MEFNQETTTYSTDPFFVPFFPHSVNVICSATNSGKTTLLINILKNRNLCFSRSIQKAVVVLCNPQVNGEPYLQLAQDNFDIEVIYLDEFLPQEHLSPNVVLIFEDVPNLTKDILDCIRVFAHHLNLASLFIVCQSIFAEEEFKLLLSLSHRIFIYFSGTGGTKLAQYIRQFFFVNAELKEYFKTIISYAERHKNIVLFELNEIARKDKPHYLAISGFENFFNQESDDDDDNNDDDDDDEDEENVDNDNSDSMTKITKPTLVFPHLHKQDLYHKKFQDNETEIEGMDPATLPRGSYLLVKAENVVSKKQKKKQQTLDETDIEKKWNTLNHIIIDDIETGFKFDKQQKAKNLAKSLLNSKYFSFSDNGKSIMIKKQPKTAASLQDFLHIATRASGPNEVSDPKFVLFTKFLLRSQTPSVQFKNKSLLNAALNKRKKKNQVKKF